MTKKTPAKSKTRMPKSDSDRSRLLSRLQRENAELRQRAVVLALQIQAYRETTTPMLGAPRNCGLRDSAPRA
jgi:hypothetical protein